MNGIFNTIRGIVGTIFRTILRVLRGILWFLRSHWWILVIVIAVAGLAVLAVALLNRRKSRKFDAYIAPTGNADAPTNTDARGTVRTDMSKIVPQAQPQPQQPPEPEPYVAPVAAAPAASRTENDDRIWEPSAGTFEAAAPVYAPTPAPSAPVYALPTSAPSYAQPAAAEPYRAPSAGPRVYSALSAMEEKKEAPAPRHAAAPAAPAPSVSPTGTVRMTAPTPETVSPTGTVRMTEEIIGLKLHIREHRDIDGTDVDHTLYLDKSIEVGRVLPNDLVVDDQYVSSRHLSIRRETDGLYIVDLNSSNGTLVNGERLTGIQPLRSGDIAKIGMTTLKITFDE